MLASLQTLTVKKITSLSPLRRFGPCLRDYLEFQQVGTGAARAVSQSRAGIFVSKNREDKYSKNAVQYHTGLKRCE